LDSIVAGRINMVICFRGFSGNDKLGEKILELYRVRSGFRGGINQIEGALKAAFVIDAGLRDNEHGCARANAKTIPIDSESHIETSKDPL
jgi:hypothetical protein